MKRMVRQLHVMMASLLLLSLLQPVVARAALPELPATGYGKVLDARKAEIAPGAHYTWYDLQDHRGNQKVHMVEFNPTASNLELRAGTKDGYVYGMKGVTEMARHLDGPGQRVIAGVNGDFYDISGTATGVPNGMFMDGGTILTSPASSFAFGLKADGSSIYGAPQLTRSITIDGTTTNLTHINRYRGANALVLYTADYYTSTKSGADGTEVILDVVSGEVKSGDTLQLQVAEVRSGRGDAPLTDGQVVLSASGAAVSAISGLTPGDEVSASFQLEGEWADVTLAIGGNGPLVKDGVPQNTGFNGGVHPRTAIGTKADGSIVLFEVDGRQPGTSEGVETSELEQMLLDVGVIDAMNLDGGGSSTFVARMPGESGVRMMNTGSDGGERRTGNGLLLVNTAPELGEAVRLAVTPGAERVLGGSDLTFQAVGVDGNGHPAQVPAAPAWQVTPALGTITEQGVYTAGDDPGFATVQATHEDISGSAEIEVVTVIDALAFPDESRSLAPGSTLQLQVTASRDGQLIKGSNRSFTWETTGDIGSINENGQFTAADESGLEGEIIARYGEIAATMKVSIGQPPVILEDFEDGIGSYRASGAQFRTVDISEVTDPDFVRSGEKSLKMAYDFTGMTSGTSGVYLISTAPGNLQVPGYPQKISMWVYGDGNKHWLRGQMRDGNGAAFPINFTDGELEGGVNWTGWRYVEAEVTQGRPLPLTMDQVVRYMETSNTKKDAGAIYIDDIRAVYGPVDEDHEPPVIHSLSPAPDAIVTEATPEITVIAEDEGYDPVQHPGTTLIDPDHIRVYLNDEQVEYGFYPPQGRISFRPATPLAEGRHKVKVAVRDLSGNQTIEEWYFTVNLGSPYYDYKTPETVYAGRTYTVDVKAIQADTLAGGHLAFSFDPATTGGLNVLRGDKLTESQLDSQIDPVTGQVRLDFSQLDGTELAGEDVIAQIQYTVQSDILGPYVIEQVEGGVSGTHHISFVSGEMVTTGGTMPFIGQSLRSRVEAELKLTWDHYATALGEPAVFTVAEMSGGAAVGDAELLIEGELTGDGRSDSTGELITVQATEETGTYRVQAVKGDAYSPVMTFTVAPLAGTPEPYNISVTMGEDPAVSRGFAWHTHPSVTESVVELVKAAEFTDFEADPVVRVEGSSSTYTTYKDGTMRVHKATASSLEPGTDYVYRVGDGAGHVSEKGTFRTSDPEADATQFLFLTDSQGGVVGDFVKWGQTLDKAMAYMPEPEFLLHGGDLIDKSFEQREWNWWFEYAQEHLRGTTLVPVIGNHEVNGTNGYGDFLAHFNNPGNGPDGSEGISYSFDVQDTHIVVLNTEGGAAGIREQVEWLEQDLASTDKKWTIVTIHQGPYGSTYANTSVQAAWVPLFDKYGVDLVLSGHDHIYLRTFAMQGNEIAADGEGTRYVIGGSSGTKFYGLTKKPYQEVVFNEQEQVYTAVKIEGDELVLTARAVNASGEEREVDQLTLIKEDQVPPVTPPVTQPPVTNPPVTEEPEEPSEPEEPGQPEPAAPGELKPSEEQLQSGGNGQPVRLDMKGELKTLTLPGHAAELLNGSPLTVRADNLTITIPASVLAELMGSLPAEEREKGTITLTVEPVTSGRASQVVAGAQTHYGAEIRQAGAMLDFTLRVQDAGGSEHSLESFSEPITVRIPVRTDADPALTGLYFVAENGQLTYIGGKVENGVLTAALTHFSTYAVLEYNKSFADLSDTHWAASTIKQLAARQLVNGVSNEHFLPSGEVTRAEFAAMLVRVLGLAGETEHPFADVSADKWYAQEIAAAYHAGLVTGTGEGRFAPDARVTRQEMAAMLVRAHAYETGHELAASSPSDFKDLADAPAWAQEAIAAAGELGLIQGRAPGQFVPAGHGTRAESAQLMLNLIRILEA